MTSGTNSPVIVAGDTANSILAQLILGKQGLMPPSGQLPENELQIILYWIAAGAPDN